jgi:hypothetical protein
MHGLGPLLAPALALFFIVRRGLRPQRVKPGRLWVYPAVITVLAFLALGHGTAPGVEGIAIYAAALAIGAAFGWFTTQHVELTLDEATGTIMSKPTPFGTAITALVFAGRFAVDYFTTGGQGDGMKAMMQQHGASLVWIANAGLLFVAARGLARAAHMWIRIRPLLDQHKAATLAKGTTPDGQ